MKQTVTLHFSRETKGAVLFEEPKREQGDPHYMVGNIYLRKAFLKEHMGVKVLYPSTITVTVDMEA